MIIADTGAIVGFLDSSDEHHEWIAKRWQTLPAPFVTCEAVIVESCYLLRHLPGAKDSVLELVESKLINLEFSLPDEITQVRELMQKYESVPMSLADACLVRLSEFTKRARIFTLDSDFWIYRRNGNEEIPLIIPPNRQK